ncbi:MAG TPA: hypothetical protein DCQ93_00555 [Bacteroidetes bacterium]|nr:hypothetical protein [Bacteroidota bacterium]
MDLKELKQGVDPNTFWYYQTKKLPLIRFITKIYKKHNRKVVLVDVGSGSGFFMYEMERLMPEMIEKIFLVDIGYSDEEIKMTQNQKIEKTLSLPDKIENAIVVMMDVLEHLESDDNMLNEIRNRTSGVNYFFITVPAFMDLWSGHDVYLGHYRRYTSKTLRALLTRTGITNYSMYYLYGAIFPAVWIFRKMVRGKKSNDSDIKPINPVVNSLLKFYHSIEMPLSRMNKLFGVTCAAEGEL